ncbi:hypothetical protein ABBQ38_006251 [Trebouxia sp. C0009 RCD-2024]
MFAYHTLLVCAATVPCKKAHRTGPDPNPNPDPNPDPNPGTSVQNPDPDPNLEAN